MQNIRNNCLLALSIFLLSLCNPKGVDPDYKDVSIAQVDESLLREMINQNVFGEHSPVPVDRLRVINVRHFGMDGQIHHGKVMVLDACSQHVKRIFEELYEQKFAIERIKLATAYGGSDSLSMADNNTSAHHLRVIAGGEQLSLHAYGAAIDLNPVQNPYIDIPCLPSDGLVRFQPVDGVRYANRRENRPGKAHRKGMAEEVIEVFARNGFYVWGGYWDCPIDYQHFQVSRSITELLVAMEPEEAAQFFHTVTDYYNKHQVPLEDVLESKTEGKLSLVALYQTNCSKFRKMLENL